MLRVFLILFICIVMAVLIGLGFTVFASRDLSPAYLEDEYTDASSRFVSVDGLRVHVREAGEANPAQPSLVMIHGLGAHLQTWDGWTDALAPNHHVVRFDLPGHGLTGPDPAGVYTNDHTLERITALIDELGLGQVVMVGNSLGGLMAWRYAAENPDRVTGLVMLAPGGLPLPGTSEDGSGEVPALFGLIQYIFPRSAVKAVLTNLYGTPSRLTDPTVVRYHELLRRPGNRPALIARLASFELTDPEEALRSIETPTLLLWGEQDQLLPVAQADRFDSWMPNITTLRLPGVGHMPMEEVPDLTVTSVETFLSGL